MARRIKGPANGTSGAAAGSLNNSLATTTNDELMPEVSDLILQYFIIIYATLHRNITHSCWLE